MPKPVPPGVTGGAILEPPGAKKFGRRAPTPVDYPRLWFCHYFRARGRGALPAPPPASGRYKAIGDWGMKKNDQLGICVVASAAHLRMLFSLIGSGKEDNPSDDTCVSLYHKWCGPGDHGCMLPDVLHGWSNDGIDGSHLSAFAAVHGDDPVEVRQSINLFGGNFAAASLPQSAIDEFDAGKPWSNTSQRGDPNMGHGFPLVGYDAKYVYLITWRKVQAATWAWISKYVGKGDGEAWCLIDPDWLSKEPTPPGYDVETLLADWEELTHTHPPEPPMPPEPPVPPTPNPDVLTCAQEFIERLLSGAGFVTALLQLVDCLHAKGQIPKDDRVKLHQKLKAKGTGLATDVLPCVLSFITGILAGSDLVTSVMALIGCLLGAEQGAKHGK